MAHLFPKADASEYQADASRVQSLVLACQQDLYHGMMEVSYSPHEQTTLFFVENKVTSVYTTTAGGWTRHPAADYSSHFQDAEGNVRIIALPVAGIRIGRILIEGLEGAQKFSLPTSDLKIRLNEWQRRTIPTLSHLLWQEAEAVLVIPGNQMPIHTALFVSREQSLGEEKAVARAVSWGEANCEVAAYGDHRKTEAYQEYRLHSAFCRAMELILHRYSDMSSRRLANSLSEVLNSVATTNKWHINSMDCQVTDDEIFGSPQAASDAYQMLIGSCIPQMENMIGPRLTKTIFQEATNLLNKIDRVTLEQYPILSPLKAPHE